LRGGRDRPVTPRQFKRDESPERNKETTEREPLTLESVLLAGDLGPEDAEYHAPEEA
jgi:hypothetical protein